MNKLLLQHIVEELAKCPLNICKPCKGKVSDEYFIAIRYERLIVTFSLSEINEILQSYEEEELESNRGAVLLLKLKDMILNCKPIIYE